MSKVHIPDVEGVFCGSNSFAAQCSARDVCSACVRAMWKAIDRSRGSPVVECMGALFKFPDRASYRRWLRYVVAGVGFNLADFGAFEIGESAPNVTDITPEAARAMLAEDRAQARALRPVATFKKFV